MLEIPEACTMARQLKETLTNKTVTRAVAGFSPHGFAWYAGDPAAYSCLLEGKTVTDAVSYGGRPELRVGDMILSFSDGVNIRYAAPGEKRPKKHQLLLEFSGGGAVVCTVQMYGGMFCFPDGTDGGFYDRAAKEKPSPLSDKFDRAYFTSLLTDQAKKLSAKAFLATEQRIPGLGNGVLQDILWNAKLHPKRKMATLSETQLDELYNTLKTTLKAMMEQGGRESEKDLFGNSGGYHTVMSKKNDGMPCPACGGLIKRMAYLGGNVYVCEGCQQ